MERFGDFREKSFWMATTEYTPNPPLEGELRVDVAIVGGGFTGTSTAYHLRRLDPGVDVAVLEGGAVGYGASGRNGGFAMTVFGVSLTVTRMLHGLEKTRQAYRYMVEAVEYLDRLVREEGLRCDYERSGFLRAATTPGYARRIQHELRLAEEIGLEGVEWWDEARVRQEVDSPLFLGGWWEPRCALVHPAKLVRELKGRAEREGVRVYEGTPVLEVAREAGGVRLRTPRGTVRAEKVVLATNAWSHLFPWIRRFQVPAWTYMVATVPLTEEQLAAIGWGKGRMGIEDARNLIHYFRLSPDNRILMGGGPVILGFGRRMGRDRHPGAFRHLGGFLRRVFPQLASVPIEYRWGGPFSVTLDLVPALGTLDGGRVLYSVGCIGHGVALAPSNGRILAELALERRTERTEELWFVERKPWPWPPEPLRLALSAAIRAYLQAEDAWYERKGLGPMGA